MEQELFLSLTEKFMAGTASENERILLEEYYERLGRKEPSELTPAEAKLLEDEMLKSLLQRINENTPVLHLSAHNWPWRRWAVAAAVILFLAGGIWWFKAGKLRQPITQSTENLVKSDILPGSDRAVLTLADGSAIVLDSTKTGTILQEGNTRVQNLDGRLAYEAGSTVMPGTDKEVSYNKLSTPRGGQYRLILPDGTKVWLNAASSIHYPTVFTGKERKVTITGEAYFEVARNMASPFKVFTAPASGKEGMEIEVLGTHFNVMAYAEEPALTTTLLEGSVKVIRGGENVLLRPGQQTQVISGESPDTKIRLLRDVNTAAAIAWKDGFFQFDDADIRAIMNQVSRWYAVDIVYPDKLSEKKFNGKIQRSVNVSKVLSMLEYAGIHFQVEGNRIIVLR